MLKALCPLSHGKAGHNACGEDRATGRARFGVGILVLKESLGVFVSILEVDKECLASHG